MVAMHEATVRRAGEEILSNVDLEVPVGARAVVVGPNGCGKTTLLTTIAAQDPVEGGFLDVRASSVGWLRQEAIGGSKKTVYHEAVSQMPAMMAKMQMEASQKALSEAKEADVLAKQQAYEEATSKFEAAGGRSMERKIEDVLTGLGFSSADFEKSCSELSGGWQMRVALARALLREPELLLLDEPTNHMDASAKNWLATYLAAGLPETSTLLLVTHDRSLLEEMHCSQVYEIAERRILRYDVSGIAEWEKSREQRVAKLQKEMLKIERTIAADEDYVRRFGAKSSHAAQAQARKKRIAKAEKELEDLRGQTRGLPSASVLSGKKGSEEDSDDDAQGLLPLSGPGKVKFNLPDWPLGASPPLDRKLLTLKETEIRYDGGEPVLNIEEFVVSAGQRLALLGPNGCGKTTLLRSLAGRLEVEAGCRILGAGGLRRARVAFFTQDLAQDLPGDITPVEHVLGDDAPISLDKEGARAALGALGLRGACHNAPIKTLSGGEKARVALAVFATRPADVLLLDEPTNHLDGAAVASLCAGLREHGGAVLVSSHDKAFLEALRVTDQVHIARAEVGEPGHLKVIHAPVARDFGAGGAAPSAPAGASAHVAEAIPGPSKAAPKPSADKAKLKRKISSVMRRIEHAEGLLQEAADAMNAEYNEETVAAYEAANANVEEMYADMQSLEDQLATA